MRSEENGMRIERKGSVEPLTPRLVRYMIDRLGAVSMDDMESPEQRRIDYTCYDGLLAIEMKTLEGPPSERLNNYVDQLRDREDFPIFLGSVEMDAVIANMSEPDTIRRKVLERLGRAIVTHLKKADDQLGAHQAAFPRKEMVRAVLLINEHHPEYEPEAVAYIVMAELRRERDGHSSLPNIDVVLYFSEKHGTVKDNLLALPMLTLEGPGMAADEWKSEVVNRFMKGWAEYNGYPVYHLDQSPQFQTIEDIPEQMPRHELWRLQYRRNPYLRGLSQEQLRDRFDEVIVLSLLFGIKDAPIRLSMPEAIRNIELFTHMQMEMQHRHLPITSFAHSLERDLAAARRLKLPESVLAWLRTLEAKRQ